MEIKRQFNNQRILKILIGAVFLFALCPGLQAQSGGFYLDRSSARPRFVQRLTWTGGEYAIRYEVVMEREEAGVYSSLIQEFTTMSFIEVSLPPGMYRFRVIPYDYLDRPGTASQWMSIEVLAALNPELDVTTPELAFSLDEDVYVMSVSGRNLTDDSEVYLRGNDGELIIPSEKQISPDGTTVRLIFEKDQFYPGDFELVIRNPGGLETSMGGITISYDETGTEYMVYIRKPFKFTPDILHISAAWKPILPVYYDENQAFGREPSGAGAAINLGLIYSRWDLIEIGIEIGISLYNSEENAASPEIGLLVQKWFPNRVTALIFRTGIGITMMGGDDKTENLFHTSIATSFFWLITRNIFAEAGVGYTHMAKDEPSGYITPWIGIGMQL
ncbi:MAG: hypothetical protein FWG99_02415 [Treponema sp.]|nr:hypothetical protein [Treponema sp.]